MSLYIHSGIAKISSSTTRNGSLASHKQAVLTQSFCLSYNSSKHECTVDTTHTKS